MPRNPGKYFKIHLYFLLRRKWFNFISLLSHFVSFPLLNSSPFNFFGNYLMSLIIYFTWDSAPDVFHGLSTSFHNFNIVFLLHNWVSLLFLWLDFDKKLKEDRVYSSALVEGSSSLWWENYTGKNWKRLVIAHSQWNRELAFSISYT